MTGYTIFYTDPAKNSTPIIVEDNTKNSQSTSLTLIGRNYPGYGQAIAENLVHLLENFAASTPPNNPIEGQLWFDTSDPNNKKLRINDGGISGARWSPINGVFQQPNQPNNVKQGDIWVDTANQQLKFYNGVDFTLVGPDYSSATRTGSYPLQWNDTLGNTHQIIINYVDDVPINIITGEAFTPNPVIDGFITLNAGLNISNNYPKVYGIADSASSLQISIPSSQKISADNFMRKDIPQFTRGALQILVDGNSLQIGTEPTFILERRSGYDAVLSNQNSQGQFTFEVLNFPLVKMDGPSRRVQINTSATQVATAGLEIFGSIRATSSATFNTLYIQSPLSNINQVSGNAIEVVGGAGISGTLIVNGQHILTGPLTLGQAAPAAPTVQSIVVPVQDGVYDLGGIDSKWRNVYGNIFLSTGSTARFIGIASFATALASPSPFSMSGDLTSTPVNFSGNGSGVVLSPIPTQGFINNRTSTTETTGTDSLLVATPTQIFKQSKRSFLKDVNYQDGIDPVINPGYSTPAGSLVPIGTVMPWAGDTTPPPGWLFCDGAEIPAELKYQNLKDLIQKKYDPAGVSFLTPNLNGRLYSGTSPNIVLINYIIKY